MSLKTREEDRRSLHSSESKVGPSQLTYDTCTRPVHIDNFNQAIWVLDVDWLKACGISDNIPQV